MNRLVENRQRLELVNVVLRKRGDRGLTSGVGWFF